MKEKPQERLGIWIQTDEPQGNHLVFTKCKSTSTTQIKCNLMQIKGFATSSTQHLCLSEYVSYLQWALKMYLCHRVYSICTCNVFVSACPKYLQWKRIGFGWRNWLPIERWLLQLQHLSPLNQKILDIWRQLIFVFVLVFLLYLCWYFSCICPLSVKTGS